MERNELMEAVQEILENGADLPAKVTNKLLAGMNIYSFGVAKKAEDKADKNEKDIIRLKVLFGSGGALAGLGALLKHFNIL